MKTKNLFFIIASAIMILSSCNMEPEAVITVKFLDSNDSVDVINIIKALPGDTVWLRVHTFVAWNNVIVPDPDIKIFRYSRKMSDYTYYSFAKKNDCNCKDRQTEWVVRGTPPDSVLNSGNVSGQYPSLKEGITIKKVVVKKYIRR